MTRTYKELERIVRNFVERLQCKAEPLCLFSLFLLISGCSQLQLPPMESISGQEEVRVRSIFNDMRDAVSNCSDSIDADVTIRASYNGFIGNKEIVLDGFLLAQVPSFLKYVAVNPLGQPVIILVSDGVDFRYVVVPDNKEYVGKVSSETFRKFFPSELGGYLFKLLTGRPDYGRDEILSIGKDRYSSYYWVALHRKNDAEIVSFLFDPVLRQVLGIHIRNKGGVVLQVDYNYLHKNGDEQCNMPAKVLVSSPSMNSSFSISFQSITQGGILFREDFSFVRPENFEVIIVQ